MPSVSRSGGAGGGVGLQPSTTDADNTTRSFVKVHTARVCRFGPGASTACMVAHMSARVSLFALWTSLALVGVEARAAAPVEPASSATAAPDVTDEAAAQPVVVVPSLLGVDAKKGAAAHKALLAELTKQLGSRVVAVAPTLKAQVDAGVTSDDLATVTGVSRVAKAANAERVVVVTVTDEATDIAVYASLDGAPPLSLQLPRKKKDPLDLKWATTVATAVATRAEDALAARIEAPVMDLSEPEPPPPPPPVVKPPPRRPPHVYAAVGGGVAFRSVDVSGPLAAKVAPMNLGASPSVSLFVSFEPLRIAAPSAWWSELSIDLAARRGFVDARAGDVSCAVDDDDVTLGVSWRARLSDNTLVPRVGGGVSAGLERFLIGGCPIPALSTQSTQAAGFVRISEAVLPELLDVDLTLGARVPVVGGSSGFERPGYLAQLALTSTPVRVAMVQLYLRAVARAWETRLTISDGDLVVGDARSSVELQLGGAL